jgi:hypothetical protein
MAGATSEWTKVVTNPLGLVGFVLFLVFGVLAKVKARNERRWLVPVAISAALVALIGGLGLAYVQVRAAAAASSQPQPSIAPAVAPQKPTTVIQETSGPGSPAVQGVQGDVNITVDQSSPDAPKTKPPTAKPVPSYQTKNP